MVYISRVHECINLTVCIGYIAFGWIVYPIRPLKNQHSCVLTPKFSNSSHSFFARMLFKLLNGAIFLQKVSIRKLLIKIILIHFFKKIANT